MTRPISLSSDRSQPGRGTDRDRGASLVEFALVAPLLIAILFAIVDFGYGFSRMLDVRHGAREAARLVAVNYGATASVAGDSQSDVIINEICRRMDGATGSTVALERMTSTGTASAGAVGQRARVTVTRPLKSLSGVYGPILDGKQLKSDIQTRIEVTSTWTTRSGTCS